jgi:hypothetical protein
MPDHARPHSAAKRSILLVLIALFGSGAMSSIAAPYGRAPAASESPPATRSYRTANGIIIQAGTPLPIFAMQAPAVNGDGVSNLAQQFSGIYDRQGALTDTYRGGLRYTVPNTATNSILERYSATGGFYAYNAKEAFGETAQGSLTMAQAETLACNFLFKPNSPSRSFVNVDGLLLVGHDTGTGQLTPQFNALRISAPTDCAKPGYSAHLIWSNTQASGGQTLGTPQAIGAVVEVPMSLNTGQFSQTPSIPLGGAGGHISLLFRPSPAAGGFSLDSSVPGLAAMAMPFYARSLNFTRNAPAVDAAQAQVQVEQQVRSSYPNATNVTVPTPNLLYMADEAGSPQKALEPDLNFEGIQVTDGGVTFTLKDINLPAVQSGSGGFGPSVTITSPASGSTFTPGSNVNLAGSIVAGAAPYSYTWELEDGTPLKQGPLANDGTVSVTTSQLPVVSHNGVPAPTTVILRVTDNEGAVRAAMVSLNPSVAPSLFLPVARRGETALSALQAEHQAGTTQSIGLAGFSNYTFGQESGWDYPPYGPGGSDLPGVVPDANGFRAGMLGYGWNLRFSWANASAWERDWRDCSLSGGDCTYGVDRADFVYYTGHGSNGGISLPSSVDSSWFPGTNARFSSLRWVGFSSCLTLRAQWPTPGAEPIRNWFNAFQGAHMLLGFNSVMADIAFGGPLVDNMRMPTFLGIPFPWAQRTIREAWVLTAFNMNAGKPAYIYAVGTNGVNPVDNKLPQPTDPLLPRPYPVASWHWVWWDV